MLDAANIIESRIADYDPTSSLMPTQGAAQLELEALYSKYQLIPAMREDFRQDFTQALEDAGIPADFGIDLLVQIALHRRAGIPTMVGILKHFFKDEANPAQACADMILKACEEDVLDWDTESNHLVLRYEISADTQDMIDRYQYPLPMIEEPRPVRHNSQTGYRTIKGSIILKKNHHEEDVCLDHINRMNSQKLQLNAHVVSLVQNQWRNLDKPKEGESFSDFRKRKKAFAKFDRTSREVISALMLAGDGFWMTHKYDKRGRTYSQGYHIQPQGNDWAKACVEFAHAEPLKEA